MLNFQFGRWNHDVCWSQHNFCWWNHNFGWCNLHFSRVNHLLKWHFGEFSVAKPMSYTVEGWNPSIPQWFMDVSSMNHDSSLMISPLNPHQESLHSISIIYIYIYIPIFEIPKIHPQFEIPWNQPFFMVQPCSTSIFLVQGAFKRRGGPLRHGSRLRRADGLRAAGRLGRPGLWGQGAAEPCGDGAGGMFLEDVSDIFYGCWNYVWLLCVYIYFIIV